MEAFERAIIIAKKLQENGFVAYFAGGWVRDFLMGHPSDDIDIATTATPEEVIALFPKTVEVGKAFGVVVVVMDDHQFEVASFRKEGRYLDGRKPESVERATPEEDAARRDFTINGMFYDPVSEKIYDFVEGEKDLRKGVVHAIGSASERFVEDRLRMIRGVRFTARFGFQMHPETERAIRASAHSLFPSVSPERIWNELSRMARRPGVTQAVQMLYDLGLLTVIFPELEEVDPEELKQRIEPFERMNHDLSPVLFYAKLFPTLSLVTIFDRLRISNHEKKLLELYQLVRDGGVDTLVEWTKFYANRDSEKVLSALAATRNEAFQVEHRERRKLLALHIERVESGRPLITSEHLKEIGVAPGPEMGRLLREAERMAIEEDLQKEEILNRLKEELHGS